MTIDRLVALLTITLWLIIAFLVYLKYREAVKDLNRAKEALESSKVVLEIKVKARTRELEELAQSLEDKVKQRTKELQGRVNELERFHRLTIGREMKMVELKQKIRKMEAQLREVNLNLKKYAEPSTQKKNK